MMLIEDRCMNFRNTVLKFSSFISLISKIKKIHEHKQIRKTEVRGIFFKVLIKRSFNFGFVPDDCYRKLEKILKAFAF